MLSEVTTGVAADAGNVLGGGCPVDRICPSALTVVARELARTPVPN